MVEDPIDGGVVVDGRVVQPGPSLAPAGGPGDARLAAGNLRAGPREPHHAQQLRGPHGSLRQGPDRLLDVRCPGALRGRAAAGFRPDVGLGRRQALAASSGHGRNGFTVKPLANGDCLLTIRHDGCRDIVVEGDDPQESLPHDRLHYEGAVATEESAGASAGKLHVASLAGRGPDWTSPAIKSLIGRADTSGGKADVYLDGVKQLCGIDFWCPQARDQQVLCYKNGLTQGKHTLEIVAGDEESRLGRHAGLLDAAQFSAAEGENGFGQGSGPTATQRVIFGYVGRKDYVDSAGQLWRPATEFIMRLGGMADLVPASFWTEPQLDKVGGTSDPELTATASTAATSPPTSPWRPSRRITCG